ncbi:hypothetical protein MHYP_G00325520 [Metynnis hypsauchen]
MGNLTALYICFCLSPSFPSAVQFMPALRFLSLCSHLLFRPNQMIQSGAYLGGRGKPGQELKNVLALFMRRANKGSGESESSAGMPEYKPSLHTSPTVAQQMQAGRPTQIQSIILARLRGIIVAVSDTCLKAMEGVIVRLI